MNKENIFKDDALVDILLALLKMTEIHQDASNSYYITTRTDDLVVKFLTGFDTKDVDNFRVYIISEYHDVYTNGGKLSLSYDNRKKLLDVLNERIKNRKPKTINDNDFDKIFLMLKKRYKNAGVAQYESISTDFAHELKYLFQSIPGNERYIYGAWLSKLYALIQKKYSANIKNSISKTKQRTA